MRKLKCSAKDPNHSKDVFEVWYGRPEPIELCGFHYQKWSHERKANPANNTGKETKKQAN